MANDFDKVYELVGDAFDTGASVAGGTPVEVDLQRQLTVLSKTLAIFNYIERITGHRLYLGNLDASPQ